MHVRKTPGLYSQDSHHTGMQNCSMKIKDPIGDPATFEDIGAFEKKHGIHLPDDYRQFLNIHNGGRPERAHRVFTFQTRSGAVSESLVNWFSGLVSRQNYSLENDIETYAERIPGHMLPIACDPFGNVILLDLREPGKSGIWFWDHEKEPASIQEAGIYKIADSFTEFVKGLSPIPD